MNFLILLVLLSIASGVQPLNVYVEKIQNLILDTINEPAPDFVPCNEDVLQKAKFGDMIEIKRTRGYFHWCVLYKEETVINFDNPDFDKLSVENVKNNFTGHVQLRNLKELAGSDFCRINNKISESKRRELSTLSECQTAQLMKEKLEHNVTWYNVVNYNCEHFATELKFGVPFSSQIEAAKQVLAKEEFKEVIAKLFGITEKSITTSGGNFPVNNQSLTIDC